MRKTAKTKLTRSDVFTALIGADWKQESATFIALHYRDRPKTETMIIGLVGRINKTKYHIPRTTPAKPKEPISRALRKQIFERDAYRCQECDTYKDLTVDHMIPESRGGTLDPDNLQTLCRPCNSKKGNRIITT